MKGKKELRQKITFVMTNQPSGDSTLMSSTNATSSTVPISAANTNPPNIGGAVGGIGAGAQGGLGNANNLQHPPPPL